MVHVDVYVPAVDCQYEFMLEETAAAEEAMKEIVDILQKKLGGDKTAGQEGFALYSCDYGRRLCLTDSLEGQQVKNGSRLLLV